MRRYVSGSRDRGGPGKASAPSVWYQLTCSAGKQRSAVESKDQLKNFFSFCFRPIPVVLSSFSTNLLLV